MSIYKTINKLLDETNGMIIDFLPKRIESENYFQLEPYYLSTYIDTFASKIINIIIKLIHNYEAHIYITETPKALPEKWNHITGKDLSAYSLEEIQELIEYVIKNDISSLHFLLYENNTPFMLSINGEFSVDLHGTQKKDIEFIELLVHQEGLFLRSCYCPNQNTTP